MKFLRYRRPSLNTLLGITKAKRKVKHSLGISQVEAWTKPSRVKQRLKYRAGWCSPTARIIRNTAKGRFPTPFGLFTKRNGPVPAENLDWASRLIDEWQSKSKKRKAG